MTQTNDLQPEQQNLVCPKCKAAMEKIQFDRFIIDRCTACKGLFFDALDREHLEHMKGSESIDIGPAHEENREERVKINCPRCHAQMIRMVDAAQPHIWYESCPVCFGLFFDAGEFRDHKEHRTLNFFKDLFYRKERK
jgi:Zn-finger nucleic acid-binding protein